MTHTLPLYIWSVDPRQDRARDAMRTTVILPIRGDTAMMITNSWSGVRVDHWLIFERFMSAAGDLVATRLSWVDKSELQTEAFDIARKYAHAIHGIDIAALDPPF